MPGGLKIRAPARNHTEESRGGTADRRRLERHALGSSMMDFAPAELSNPDPRLMLRNRLREEMEALRGILRKAELLAGKTVDNGRAEPRRRKYERFLATEDRSEATGAERKTCAKRRKTMSVAKIVEPRMSKDEITNLVTRVPSLSENMPAHIIEFLKKECAGHADENGDEMEIDLGSMRHSTMFELRKLLDEFAEEEKRRQASNTYIPISRSPQREQEDGEIVEEEDYNVTIDTCSYASPVAADKVLCSPAQLLEDSEIAEEEVVCGGTENSPSRSSSSSSSGSSSGSGCSSGGSCSDSSDSDSSDSDSDDESVTSSPAPALLPKTDVSPVLVPHKVLGSSPCLREQGETEEGEYGGGASPVTAEKLAETENNPRISPAPAVLPEPLEQRQVVCRDLIAKGRAKKRRLCHPERQRAYEELEEMERKAKPISDWIHPMHLSQLGITPVEYAVTSERRVPGRSCPVQRLLGLFLKAE